MNTLDQDRALIKKYGGPVRLAQTLNLGRYGAQRVSNWNARGIPAHVKVMHPQLFMPELATPPSNQAQEATETVAGGV